MEDESSAFRVLALSLAAFALGAAPAYGATAWAPPTELARADKYVAPLVAVDTSGDAVAAWLRFGDGSAFATRPAGAPWSPTHVNASPADPDETFLQPGLSEDDAGNATVIRISSSNAAEALFRPAGGSFGAPHGLSSGGAQVFDVASKVDRSGRVLAAWDEPGMVRSAQRTASADWAPLEDIATGGPVFALDVDVNAAGAMVMAWEESGAQQVTRAATRPPGGPWSTPVTLATTDYDPSPAVAVDDAGIATVVWSENGPVVARSAPVGGAWGPKTTVSPPGTGGSEIDVDAGSVTTAVWRGTHAGVGGEAVMAATRAGDAWQGQGDVD